MYIFDNILVRAVLFYSYTICLLYLQTGFNLSCILEWIFKIAIRNENNNCRMYNNLLCWNWSPWYTSETTKIDGIVKTRKCTYIILMKSNWWENFKNYGEIHQAVVDWTLPKWGGIKTE